MINAEVRFLLENRTDVINAIGIMSHMNRRCLLTGKKVAFFVVPEWCPMREERGYDIGNRN